MGYLIFWIGVSLVLGRIIHIVSVRVLGHRPQRTMTVDVVQGILIGAGLAFVTLLLILPNFYITKVNGWTTVVGCGEPGNGVLLRGACGVIFPGPINVPEEAMYWTTSKDGAGRKLSGQQDYILHFPAEQLRRTMHSGR